MGAVHQGKKTEKGPPKDHGKAYTKPRRKTNLGIFRKE